MSITLIPKLCFEAMLPEQSFVGIWGLALVDQRDKCLLRCVCVNVVLLNAYPLWFAVSLPHSCVHVQRRGAKKSSLLF